MLLQYDCYRYLKFLVGLSDDLWEMVSTGLIIQAGTGVYA